MKDLEHLIVSLQKSIDNRDPHIKSIKNPTLLLKSLKELDHLIGNQNIKESVASQVSHLIVDQGRQVKNDDMMLNCLLVGSPGCGKTKIGTILAKIWYALGFLKGGKSHVQTAPCFTDRFKNNEEDNTMFNIFLFIILLWVVGLTWSFYSNYGGLMTLILIITLIVVLVAIFYYTQIDKSNKDIKDIVYKNYEHIEEHIHDHEMIKIVSRVDFIGGFLGSSALKTQKLLEESLGKVLFVDEAYSLYQSSQDSFGFEALTALNLFMSEHPNEIIVIFAGYLDKIEQGPFAAQSGLARRFMWQFKCEGYNSEELFDIFKSKTSHKKWILEKPHEMQKLFDEYYEHFTNFGGDCEKIFFFSTLEHSKEFMNGDIDMNTLKVEHVRRGILKLLENSITGKSESKNLTQYECEDIKETLKKYMQSNY